jgi:hypothetical protein
VTEFLLKRGPEQFVVLAQELVEALSALYTFQYVADGVDYGLNIRLKCAASHYIWGQG